MSPHVTNTYSTEIPPPQILDVIEMVVSSMEKSGPSYEQEICKKQAGNPNFAFLNARHKFHAFYCNLRIFKKSIACLCDLNGKGNARLVTTSFMHIPVYNEDVYSKACQELNEAIQGGKENCVQLIDDCTSLIMSTLEKGRDDKKKDLVQLIVTALKNKAAVATNEHFITATRCLGSICKENGILSRGFPWIHRK